MALSPWQKYILSIGIASLISLNIGWQLGHRDITISRQKSSFLPSIQIKDLSSNQVSNADMAQFWKVWNIISTKYVEKEKVTPQKLIEGATAGLVNALDDPYSVYLTPEQNKESKADLEGKFEGVGMQLGYNDQKQLIVISPLTGSPAENAGIKPGDKIWMIDDKETPGITLVEAVDKIRGPKGTKVKLKMQHENSDLFDVELTRDTIYIKSVEAKLLEGDTIGYIRINRFGDSTETEWDEAVKTITDKKISKVIVDVRSNPGGYLETAKYINSDFMTGTVVAQEDYMGQRTNFPATHPPRLQNTKVIGLINKGSASASEIVAGGLQDRGIAKLVGEKSFGKGTIQEVEDLNGGYGIHLTIAKWLLPSGTWIHKKGLTPDYEVKIEDSDTNSKKDPQLDKAVELLK